MIRDTWTETKRPKLKSEDPIEGSNPSIGLKRKKSRDKYI